MSISPLSTLSRIFRSRSTREQYRALYDKAVQLGRDPAWYVQGGVSDTINGRFDMIAAILALILLRLESEGAATSAASALITELFIEDMEGSVRQIGIGDLKVGKHVGNMVGALGGRLAAFRTAIRENDGFSAPVRRNIFHDAAPPDSAIAFVSKALENFHGNLAAIEAEALLAGALPQL